MRTATASLPISRDACPPRREGGRSFRGCPLRGCGRCVDQGIRGAGAVHRGPQHALASRGRRGRSRTARGAATRGEDRTCPSEPQCRAGRARSAARRARRDGRIRSRATRLGVGSLNQIAEGFEENLDRLEKANSDMRLQLAEERAARAQLETRVASADSMANRCSRRICTEILAR